MCSMLLLMANGRAEKIISAFKNPSILISSKPQSATQHSNVVEVYGIGDPVSKHHRRIRWERGPVVNHIRLGVS